MRIELNEVLESSLALASGEIRVRLLAFDLWSWSGEAYGGPPDFRNPHAEMLFRRLDFEVTCGPPLA